MSDLPCLLHHPCTCHRCGPAQHVLRLLQARPDMQGWALDRNAAMLEYAKGRAAAAGIQNVTFVEGDMSGFHIKVGNRAHGWQGRAGCAPGGGK